MGRKPATAEMAFAVNEVEQRRRAGHVVIHHHEDQAAKICPGIGNHSRERFVRAFRAAPARAPKQVFLALALCAQKLREYDTRESNTEVILCLMNADAQYEGLFLAAAVYRYFFSTMSGDGLMFA